jgi:hypothetical protein
MSKQINKKKEWKLSRPWHFKKPSWLSGKSDNKSGGGN